jgi:hypothetical protein
MTNKENKLCAQAGKNILHVQNVESTSAVTYASKATNNSKIHIHILNDKIILFVLPKMHIQACTPRFFFF